MKNIALAVLFTVGILLAGSDGEWFPWVNTFGVCLFGLIGRFLSI